MCEDFLVQMQSIGLRDQAQAVLDWSADCLKDLDYHTKCSPYSNRLSLRVPRRGTRAEGRAFLTIMLRNGHFVYHLNAVGYSMHDPDNWDSLDYNDINTPDFCNSVKANYNIRLNA
jgi:hypothetical protein